jgi:predicted GNAT family acetyltransferase
MQVVRWPNAAAFLARAEPFLLADTARHNFALSGALALLQTPDDETPTAAPFLATVEDGERVIAVATHRGPYSLVISPSAEVAAANGWPWLAALAQEVRRATPELSGIQAPPELARAFADEWERMGGPAARLVMSIRLHALDEVRPLRPVPGHLRRAIRADLELVFAWMEAMRAEAIPHDPPIDAEQLANVRLADTVDPLRALYLWVSSDDEPRSVCGAAGPTPVTARINAVYTPPEHRRQGYATAAVAELSRRIMATGRRCLLNTDLANPTSNRIYAEIGYRPISDVDLLAFGTSRPSG